MNKKMKDAQWKARNLRDNWNGRERDKQDKRVLELLDYFGELSIPSPANMCDTSSKLRDEIVRCADVYHESRGDVNGVDCVTVEDIKRIFAESPPGITPEEVDEIIKREFDPDRPGPTNDRWERVLDRIKSRLQKGVGE